MADDILVTGLKHVAPNKDNQSIRLEFATSDDTIAVRMPLASAEGLLPFLEKATSDLRAAIATGAPSPQAFHVQKWRIFADEPGFVVLAFELPGGAMFRIRIDSLRLHDLQADPNNAVADPGRHK